MDKERAEEILKDNNMTKVAFAESVGLKIGTVRNAFRKKAFSARMVTKLEELEGYEDLSVIEGIVRQTMNIPLKKTAKVIGVPKNRFLRLIRFDDGVRGKFRCKPDKFLRLGEEVSVRHIDGEMWELVK